jgi:small GTP-binding protein
MIGDKSVGKTSIVKRYTENTFSTGTESTIGAQFTSKVIEIAPSGVVPVEVKLQIWDTAGEEKFRSITPMYYKNAASVILIYDITSEDTFTSISRWVSEIENNGAN